MAKILQEIRYFWLILSPVPGSVNELNDEQQAKINDMAKDNE